MKLLISLPIYDRAWILPDWFKCIENQSIPLSEIGFIFELAPNDEDTQRVLFEWHAAHPEVWCFNATIRVPNLTHKSHMEGHRTWVVEDYNRMATMRNALLDEAIALDPDLYFSLDSDILLEDPKTIELLIEQTEICDAISPTCYMWPTGKEFPNVMTWSGDGDKAERIIALYPSSGIFEADVIMAIVMMTPRVYKNVRYHPHFQGEDLGWAWDALRKGYRLFSISDLYTPHVMHKWMLQQYHSGGDGRGRKRIYTVTR